VRTHTGALAGRKCGHGVPTAKIRLGTPCPRVPTGNDGCYDHDEYVCFPLYIHCCYAICSRTCVTVSCFHCSFKVKNISVDTSHSNYIKDVSDHHQKLPLTVVEMLIVVTFAADELHCIMTLFSISKLSSF